MTGKHRALLIGDSHARGVFDVVKNRFEGMKTMTLSSYKTANKMVALGNLHLVRSLFFWPPLCSMSLPLTLFIFGPPSLWQEFLW